MLLLLCLTLCDSMDCSPPGSSVQRIFQTRILEWVAISSCHFLPDQTQGSNPSLLHHLYWQVASSSHILSNTFWLFSYEFHHFLLEDEYCPQILRTLYFDSVLSLIFSIFLLSSFLMSNLHPLLVSSTSVVEYYWHWFSYFSKTLSNLPRRPLRRSRQPTPVSLTGEFHGQRSLIGYSP